MTKRALKALQDCTGLYRTVQDCAGLCRTVQVSSELQ